MSEGTVPEARTSSIRWKSRLGSILSLKGLIVVLVLMGICFLPRLYVYRQLNKLVYYTEQENFKIYDQSDIGIALLVPELIRIHKSLTKIIKDDVTLNHGIRSGLISEMNWHQRSWLALQAFAERDSRAEKYLLEHKAEHENVFDP